MKNTLSTFVLLSAALLSACNKTQPIDSAMLQFNDNLAYLKNTDQLFSGTVIDYYENGQQKSEQQFENGVISGRNIFFTEDGSVKLEVNISDSFLDGIFYSKDGDYSYKATFDNGTLVQREIQYQLIDNTVIQNYAENLLSTRELNSAGELVSTTEIPYEDNNIAKASVEAEMLVVSFSGNQKLRGRLFYQNGDITFQENYVNGLLNILLYHDQADGNKIYHCYYEGAKLEAGSDEICTNLPINRGL
jgi:antitoxin component YwqK of YwqJK toxin-antitoxin module